MANSGDGTVTELNAFDGSVVRTIGVGRELRGHLSDGNYVWVTNSGNNGLGRDRTELLRTAPWSGPSASATIPLASRRTVLRLGGELEPTIRSSELYAYDGSPAHTIGVGIAPVGISSDGTHVWVTSLDVTLTELNASDGSVVQTIGNCCSSFAISSDGAHVWAANLSGESVTELNASNGSIAQTISVAQRRT